MRARFPGFQPPVGGQSGAVAHLVGEDGAFWLASVVMTPAGQETPPARLVELRAPADDDTIVLEPFQVRCG